MTVARWVGIAALAVVAYGATPSAQVCGPACKESQIEAYFERLSTVYRRGSTTEDVDRLFELFGTEVRYVHAAYDARFERDEWRDAFYANLERGAYSKDSNERIDVTTLIHGRSHTAVGYRYVRRMDDGTLRPADDQGELLALIEFEGGRIVLIQEYW